MLKEGSGKNSSGDRTWTEPEWRGDPCGERGRESRRHHSCSPNSTCCIRSCASLRESYTVRRSSPLAEASAMAATCCRHHQDPPHPVLIRSKTAREKHNQNFRDSEPNLNWSSLRLKASIEIAQCKATAFVLRETRAERHPESKTIEPL